MTTDNGMKYRDTELRHEAVIQWRLLMLLRYVRAPVVGAADLRRMHATRQTFEWAISDNTPVPKNHKTGGD